MVTRVLRADHVLPGDGPAIADGMLVMDGPTVVSVGAWDGRPAERLEGVLMPGLVNAHTHVELSSMRGRVHGGEGFVPWVDRLVTTRAEMVAEEEAEGVTAGVSELVASGTVAVGDVSNGLGAVDVLARSGIGGAVFHEVFGLDRSVVLRRIEGLLAERSRAWPTPDLSYAVAPHTLYTLHPEAARALLDRARVDGVRTSLHLAEHASERRAIEMGDGPVPEWLERRAKQSREWPRSPLFDFAESVGALRPGVLLVHLTDARPDELARVAASGASVVLCPRSNLHIEGRLPPLLAVRAAGIEAALGTDSLASNASLDVLAEARALADRFPQVPAWELVKMATWNGACALGRPDLGRLAPGTRPGVVLVEGRVSGDAAAWVLRAPARKLVVGRSA